MMSNDTPEHVNAIPNDALKQDLLTQVSTLEQELLSLNLLEHPNEISKICQQIFSLREQLNQL